jgi:hypothetical protein
VARLRSDFRLAVSTGHRPAIHPSFVIPKRMALFVEVHWFLPGAKLVITA